MTRSQTYLTTSDPQAMLSAGRDLSPEWRSSLAAKREKKGECPTCGIQIFKKGAWGKKTPLTIDGLVRQGHCLKCHPIEGYIRRFPDADTQPQNGESRPPPPQIRTSVQAQPQQQHPQQQQQEQQQPRQHHQQPPYQIRGRIPANNGSMPLIERPQSSGLGMLQQQRESRTAHSPQFRQPMPTHQLIYEYQQHESQQQQPQQYHSVPRSGIPVPRTLKVDQNADDDVSVLTMDYRLTTPPDDWSRQPELEETDGMMPPIATHRPGPDNGDGYGGSRRGLYGTGVQPRLTTFRHNERTLGLGDSWTGMDMGGRVDSHHVSWDQNGLMPPGGMDDLFRNRVGEDGPRVSEAAGFSEIQYEPRRIQPPEHKVVEEPQRAMAQHQPAVDITGPKRSLSLLSGPSYFPDDEPMYMDDDDHVDVKEDKQYHPSMNDAVDLPPLPAGVRANKPNKMVGAAMSGPMRRQVTNFSVGSASTMAPPLISRDQRGRPDEAQIHDPESLQLDDPRTHNFIGGHDLSAMMQASQPDASQVSARKIQPRYSPQLSPIRSPIKMGSMKPKLDTLDSMPSSATAMGRWDTGDPKPPLAAAGLMSPWDSKDHTSVASSNGLLTEDVMPPVTTEPAVGGLKAPPSPRLPPAHKDDDIPAMDEVAREAVVPSPKRVTDALRSLSIVEVKKSENHVGTGIGMTSEDIPVLLHCLTLHQATMHMKAKALRNLASIVWTSGSAARNCVFKLRGVETLVKTIWCDIGSIDLQDAAAHFLSALAGSTDAQPHNDLLSNEESVCDALLFAMLTHSHVESIQLKGCSIFTCLAAASSNNPSISDGSLSGALMLVLAAMTNHKHSLEIQRAGLQALHCQCALSRDAESNKRSLLDSRLDHGVTGLSIISDCMKSGLRHDMIAMEWACRLCWLLTSSEDMVNGMSETPSMIDDVIQTCNLYLSDESAGSLIQACFGVIGNMAHVELNREVLMACGAIQTLLDGLRYQQNDFSVQLEACSAFANIAQTTEMAKTILDGGGLDEMLLDLQNFNEEELAGEALRAMVCLSIHSPEAKVRMTVPDVLKLIFATSQQYRDSVAVQEFCCKLFASLCVSPEAADSLIDCGGLDFAIGICKTSSEENVLDAACSLYRNLTCHVKSSRKLLPNGALPALIHSMSERSCDVSLQTNVCNSIWNIVCKRDWTMSDGFGQHVVRALVTAMQKNSEECELLEAACGALSKIVDEDTELQNDLIDCGAVDAVYCTMIMHQRTSTLIEACGVFSKISAEAHLAQAIASAQGVSAVSEAIRNNSSSTEFLELGCLTLRNIVCHCPEYAEEASMAISPVIDAMRDNLGATAFQTEASNFLWTLAAEAPGCQTKIVALEGPTVLMQSIDRNRHDKRCNDAAVGAFTQLVMSNNQ